MKDVIFVQDYQDPVNPEESVIVIRSLVPHGVAMQNGNLVPGDRLLWVDDLMTVFLVVSWSSEIFL